MKVLNFLKKSLVYGLAGFFAAAAIIGFGAEAMHIKNVPDAYLWLMPLGFVLGLVFPDYIGNIFMSIVTGGGAIRNKDKNFDPQEIVTGRMAWVVKVFGVAALLGLLWLVIRLAQ